MVYCDHRDNASVCRGIRVINVISAVYMLIFLFAYFTVRSVMPDMMEAHAGHDVREFRYSSETEDDLYLPDMMEAEVIREMPREVQSDSGDIAYTYEIDEDSGSVYSDIMYNSSDTDIVMTYPFIMYDGYGAVNTDTGVKYEVRQGDTGMVEVIIPPGTTGHIEVSYIGTAVQRLSFWISICSGLAFITTVAGYASKHEKQTE